MVLHVIILSFKVLLVVSRGCIVLYVVGLGGKVVFVVSLSCTDFVLPILFVMPFM